MFGGTSELVADEAITFAPETAPAASRAAASTA